MLARQATKCKKKETEERNKLKKHIEAGNGELARLHAANAIRKKNEALNLLKLSSRVDAVASRVQTAITMRQVTGTMASVVRGIDQTMENMNLEQISMVMDRFEAQFEDLDVQTGYMEGAIGGATTLSMPQEEIDLLMHQVADESGLELGEGMQELPASPREEVGEEAVLNERLHSLRNAE
ncbi:hypothetical protein GGI02_002000 [Coemansia sp. RSA 2322]|uniref:Uncharacterized protein n=1 Tax=Coemansia thaxteri TaxID=2663907 RepID=A0A9W8EFY0_9FUNG|nr:hypothetical protein H4R26_002146 [Coemansia thaxteri]KAJ2471833.1 hypothetical protein GGI02_002000 [Coemansia sp. RSA 2322]KAJ2478510.1 hypothetical protein EV174_004298 [Coemansia sp. RSA 2320]